MEFCKAVEEKENVRLTIIVILESGFRKFDLETEDGKVNVVRGYYQYDRNRQLQNRNTVSYKQNNIFLVDWDEEDVGDLDFYDIFDHFFHKKNLKNAVLSFLLRFIDFINLDNFPKYCIIQYWIIQPWR